MVPTAAMSVKVGGMHWQIRYYCHAQLGPPDKGRATKGLVVCFDVTFICVHCG